MKKNNSLNWINQLVIGFFLLTSPMMVTHAACCAGHGGVASCNKITGYKMCKDGTASPSCTCPKAKSPKKATKRLKTMAIPPTSTSTMTTKSKTPSKTYWGKKLNTTTPSSTSSQGNWWRRKSTPTAIRQQRTLSSARGCCSRHGGVSRCDRVTHHQICRDGAQSPRCMCQ